MNRKAGKKTLFLQKVSRDLSVWTWIQHVHVIYYTDNMNKLMILWLFVKRFRLL